MSELLPQVRVPTLVMHVRDDLMVPIEAGRQLAAGIPGARFIALPGRNHLFLKHEPAATRFFEEINLFSDQDVNPLQTAHLFGGQAARMSVPGQGPTLGVGLLNVRFRLGSRH